MKLNLSTFYSISLKYFDFESIKKSLVRHFTLSFPAKSLKSSVYYTQQAHVNSD